MASNTVLAQMLTAAEKSAQGNWSQISGNVTNFAQTLIQSTAQLADDYADGRISEDEAKADFESLADYHDMLEDYAADALKLIAQNAFNAAIDALWSAIASSIKVA